MKQIRIFLLLGVALAWCTGAVAQLMPDAEILSTNVDFVAKKIYVDVGYNQRSCGVYKLEFKVKSKGNPEKDADIEAVTRNEAYVASVSGNQMSINNDVNDVSGPGSGSVGGYSLRLTLPGDLTEGDSVQLCVYPSKNTEVCFGCGVYNTNIAFDPDPTKSIDDGCPYDDNYNDLITCYKRKTTLNWEAYIRDQRDCKFYRIVQMPDGRWWFAQSLNYGTKSGVESPGNIFCPGVSGSIGGSGYSSEIACKNYGALYKWNHAMGASPAVSVEATGTVQGVCPDGWLIPSDKDWGDLLDAVDVCTGTTTTLLTPCSHLNPSVENDSSRRGLFAGKFLKSINTGDPSITNAAWEPVDINRADVFGSDMYGFSALPSGIAAQAVSTMSPLPNFFYGRSSYFAVWTSSKAGDNEANNPIARIIHYDRSTEQRDTRFSADNFGLSVRCVRW